MRIVRRTVAALILVVLAASPLPGCAGGGGGPMGQLAGIAMGLGVSLGSYYLVNELK
jgi:hypothetical protein